MSKGRKGHVVMLAACAFQAGLAMAGAGDPVLFSADFETGVLSDAMKKGLSQGWQQMGTMPEISREFARAGNFSAKMYLNKNTSQTPYRTMLQSAWKTTTDAGNRAEIHHPFFKDSWTAFSLYLPSTGPGNWSSASNTYEIIAQWHDAHNPFPPPAWDTEQSKNPLLSIAVSDSKHAPALHWRLVYLGEGRTPYPTLNSPRPYQYQTGATIDLGPIEPDLDKWTDFVVRVRWNFWPVGSRNNQANWEVGVYDNVEGSATSGLIQVWKNGKLVVDRSPVQIGANDNAGPVFSVGLYKGWREAAQRSGDPVVDRVVYFDEFKYGGPNATYADMAPGGQRRAAEDKTPKPPGELIIQH